MIRAIILAIGVLLAAHAGAAEMDMYWNGGTGNNGQLIWIPVSVAHPMPTTGSGGTTLTAAVPVVWDSNTTVANATIPIILPPWVTAGGTITAVKYYTNGSGSPSFTANVQIGGTGVTGCNAISVNSATPATANCTAANAFTSSSSLALVISAVSGTPNQAIVQIDFTHTPN